MRKLIIFLMAVLFSCSVYASDYENHWAKESIGKMVALDVITGTTNGLFQPDSPVTRAQLSVMVAKLLRLELKDYTGAFKDVADGVWFTPYIEAMSRENLVQGDGINFRPGDVITRQEAAKILTDAYEKINTVPISSLKTDFNDSSEIASWATSYVSKAVAYGLITGFPDGSFRPNENMSRAQAAAILSRFIN